MLGSLPRLPDQSSTSTAKRPAWSLLSVVGIVSSSRTRNDSRVRSCGLIGRFRFCAGVFSWRSNGTTDGFAAPATWNSNAKKLPVMSDPAAAVDTSGFLSFPSRGLQPKPPSRRAVQKSVEWKIKERRHSAWQPHRRSRQPWTPLPHSSGHEEALDVCGSTARAMLAQLHVQLKARRQSTFEAGRPLMHPSTTGPANQPQAQRVDSPQRCASTAAVRLIRTGSPRTSCWAIVLLAVVTLRRYRPK
jgi:hypothetical protein